MTAPCPTCNDHGRIGNGLSGPAADDYPCPEPDCAEGAAERDGAWAVREREYAQTHPTLRAVHAAPSFDLAAYTNALLRGIGRAA